MVTQRLQAGTGRWAPTALLAACLIILAPSPRALCQATLPPMPPTKAAGSPPQPSTPASAQEQAESAGSGTVVQDRATLGKVPVPQAVPSMMPAEPGSEIDRVVALVNGEVVLDSDVDEERRFEIIQPYPNTPGSSSRELEIERLVNRSLILQQAKLQSEQTVSSADADKEIEGLRKTLPGCKASDCATDAGWAHFLSKNGFTVPEFHSRWMQRMQVLSFIQERFGAGTTVSGAQVREFYQSTMLPQYAKAHVKAAPLASVEERIREVLQQQQVSNLLRDWLQSLRAQGSITILHPGEEAP